MRKKSYVAGDTIIEVMIAVTIFSLVAVGSMVLMNRGLSMAQRSLETTLVRQQIDSQAEMLRYVHARSKDRDDVYYAKIWNELQKGDAVDQILDVSSCPGSLPRGGFALVPAQNNRIARTTAYRSSPATYAKVDNGESQGLFVQIIGVDGGGAYDAYIQACWTSVGDEKPMTMGTIVRLYDSKAKGYNNK